MPSRAPEGIQVFVLVADAVNVGDGAFRLRILEGVASDLLRAFVM